MIEASRDSATVDEAVDVASGITIVARHDFRMNPEHGPLPKVLAALPALLAHPIIPNDDTYRDGAWFDFTDRFIAENRAAGRLDDVLLLARSVAIVEGLAAAFLLYVLGRRLAGPWGGTVSAALWLTTPVFIGFSHFAMIDIAFTVALLALSYCLLRFFDDPNPVTAALCGVASAAALLTRHNALPIVAVVVVAGVVVSLRHGWRAAAAQRVHDWPRRVRARVGVLPRARPDAAHGRDRATLRRRDRDGATRFDRGARRVDRAAAARVPRRAGVSVRHL